MKNTDGNSVWGDYDVEIFLTVVAFTVAALFVLGFRASIATDRLQICIDRGLVHFDGVTITIPNTLSVQDKIKLQRERYIYLNAERSLFRGASFLRLHQKHSAN